MVTDVPLHAGAFELLEPVARGGMADVWSARHRRTQRLAAVKVLRTDTPDNAGLRQTFLTDAQSIARTTHPNIVQLYDAGDISEEVALRAAGKLTAGSPYLAMEYAPDGALVEGRMLKWSALVHTLRQVLAGLAHTHSRGMIHLDVKPGNILTWGRDPQSWHLKLTDFGTARRFAERERADPERWHVVQGTPLYMAPEQFDSDWRRVTTASDVYGVGVVAYELATGTLPFFGASVLEILKQHLSAPRELPPLDAPEAFSGWLKRTLHPTIEKRFSSAGSALRALQLVGEPIRVRPIGDWREADVRVSTPLIDDEKLRLLALRDPTLVGREHEQDVLWSALKRTLATGRAQTVILSGVSGCGKSRLASWLGERAAELGIARFVRARHDQLAAAHLGLPGLLDQLLNVRDADAEAVRARISDVLARDMQVAENAQTMSYRTAVLTDYLRPTTGGYESVGSRAGDVEAAHRRVIEVLAQQEPLVVLLDDAHWDLNSLRLADELAREGRGPVLVLVTVRDEDLLDLPESRAALRRMTQYGVSSIDLGPLDRRATSTLLRELTNLDGPSQDKLLSHTDGNPLFAIALVQQLLESGGIAVRAGNARLVHSEGLEQVALTDLWLTRVDRALYEITSVMRTELTVADLRSALEIGCALGSAIDIGEWEAACAHLPTGATDTVTAALALANLAERGDGLVVLRHPLIRQAVSAAAEAAGTGAAAHQRAALTLAGDLDASGEASRERAIRIARHLFEAEACHAALHWLSLAASTDFRRPMTPVALSLYRLFSAVVLRVGEANLTIDQQLNFLRLRATIAQNDVGHAGELDSVLQRWSALAHQHGETLHFCLAQQIRAFESLFRGDIPEGIRRAEFGLSVARAMPDDPWPEVELLRALAELQSCELDPTSARGTLDRMFAILPEIESFAGAVGLFSYGRLDTLDGNIDEAERHYAEAIRISNDRGWEGLTHTISLSLAHLHVAQRRPQEAEQLTRAATSYFRMRGDTRLSYALVGLADALSQQGRHSEAVAIATEARETATLRLQHGQVAIAEILLATSRACEGNTMAAEAHLDEYEHAQSRLSFVDVWTRRYLCRAAERCASATEPSAALLERLSSLANQDL